MMQSTAGEEGDFPPNPFRTAPTSAGTMAAPVSAAPAGQTNMFAIPPTASAATNFAPPSDPLHGQGAPPPQQMSGMMNNNNGITPQQQQQPQASGAPQSRWAACASCFSPQTYMAYFDVDTVDIERRILAALKEFHKPDKFRSEVIGASRTDNLKGADLYGPFWICMTLVWTISFTSNLSAYFRADDPNEFEYDLRHLLHACTVIFGFGFGLPACFWLGTQCLGMQALMMVDWICLYGYSMIFYIPTTLLCLLPVEILIWCFLAVATGASCLLVLRNVAAPLLGADSGGSKSGPLLMCVMGCHAIFFLVLKLTFYRVHHESHHATSPPTFAPTPSPSISKENLGG
eukprot:CAMPEP_0194047362 /NCGR_PEP_ID=MMETSP0009_2-20130614/24188_1 /TAXON_ID=210454 /ORGANISM="Grammatophora oceanica, Strain CCMP 410" /LENGTH=344 /DNA_ID=CAMNT_0038692953 /DNA_START=10 /DNA_END=1044 /DNA_ORIENTATION=+